MTALTVLVFLVSPLLCLVFGGASLIGLVQALPDLVRLGRSHPFPMALVSGLLLIAGVTLGYQQSRTAFSMATLWFQALICFPGYIALFLAVSPRTRRTSAFIFSGMALLATAFMTTLWFVWP